MRWSAFEKPPFRPRRSMHPWSWDPHGIVIYMYTQNKPNVGKYGWKYASLMDPIKILSKISPTKSLEDIHGCFTQQFVFRKFFKLVEVLGYLPRGPVGKICSTPQPKDRRVVSNLSRCAPKIKDERVVETSQYFQGSVGYNPNLFILIPCLSLGGGFVFFLVTPNPGEMIQFDLRTLWRQRRFMDPTIVTLVTFFHRDLTANDLFGPQFFVAFWKGNGTPTISGKSRLATYYDLARVLANIWKFLHKSIYLNSWAPPPFTCPTCWCRYFKMS